MGRICAGGGNGGCFPLLSPGAGPGGGGGEEDWEVVSAFKGAAMISSSFHLSFTNVVSMAITSAPAPTLSPTLTHFPSIRASFPKMALHCRGG